MRLNNVRKVAGLPLKF